MTPTETPGPRRLWHLWGGQRTGESSACASCGHRAAAWGGSQWQGFLGGSAWTEKPRWERAHHSRADNGRASRVGWALQLMAAVAWCAPGSGRARGVRGAGGESGCVTTGTDERALQLKGACPQACVPRCRNGVRDVSRATRWSLSDAHSVPTQA